MEPAKVRDAARLLVEARRTGKRVPGLPQELQTSHGRGRQRDHR